LYEESANCWISQGEKSETHSIRSVPLRFGLQARATDKPTIKTQNTAQVENAPHCSVRLTDTP
jgi:hypothetical protein